jgi:ABC-type glycerol-3-phosphate transport system substrate-binding protein
MKKLLAIILATLAVLALAAGCAKQAVENPPVTSSSTTSTPAAMVTTTSSPTPTPTATVSTPTTTTTTSAITTTPETTPVPPLADPIETKYGLVSGEVITDAGQEIHMYKGIPYAAPPVGELRWKPPQPPAP